MTKTESDRIFNRNKWVYSISGIGRDMSYTLFSSFLLLYVMYTRQLTGAQFAAIGIIMTICRIWDGINDPLMGSIVENTRTRFGKFKPWILSGAVTNATVLILIFTLRIQGWAFVALFAILYLLWDITFTANDIGYWSMLPSLTSDPTKRNSLTSLANLFAMLGSIIAFGFVPILTNGPGAIGGNSIAGYAAVGTAISLIFLLCQVMAVIGIKERKFEVAPRSQHIGFKRILKVILKNDQLLWVTLIMFLYNAGSSLLTAFGVNYVYLSFGYDGFNVTLFVAFYAFASVAVNAAYPFLSRKFSRRKLSTGAVIITVFGYGLFFLNGLLLPLHMSVLCAEAVVISAGQSLFYMVTTICLVNTIEYNEYKTGARDEAIIFSLRPFMAKLDSALQQLLITIVYIVVGLTAITNRITDIETKSSMGSIGEAEKASEIKDILLSAPATTAQYLKLFMVVLPILFITFAYWFMRRKTTIDEESYCKMLAEIEERRTHTD